MNKRTNHKPVIRYPRYFTVKAWNKFDLTQQDILCGRYDIILTDWKTKREKTKEGINNIFKNIDKGINIFNKGMKEFDKGMKAFDQGLKGNVK